MTRRSVRMASSQIFEKLKNSQVYRNGFAEQKQHIITRLFMMKDECVQFAQTPGRHSYQVNGFLVEHCARLSHQLPKNTPKAQYISEVIIDYLHNHALANPDYIWLKIQGKRMTFIGIGEVKSHPLSVGHRPKQLFFQATNIRNLIESGEIASLVSKRYHVALADTFAHYLVLPRSIHAPHSLLASVPLDWEVKEIEFTLPEILFLKHLLCTATEDLHEDSHPYLLRDYQPFARKIMTQIEEIIADLFRDIFPIEKDTTYALAVWSMIYNTIPTNRESVDLVRQWMQTTVPQYTHNGHSLIFTLPASIIEFPARQDICYHALAQCADGDNTLLPRILLSRLQETKQNLPDPPELSQKQEIDILALL
ncbi:MAG: hypothetical protein G01um101466_749 [Parcubacteria group bacterium Gr01-1014_66]|nr:MAG: hypothetical protein G01um101466_749 [Parcubacteria group bacterium Gr01-1014_66]